MGNSDETESVYSNVDTSDNTEVEDLNQIYGYSSYEQN